MKTLNLKCAPTVLAVTLVSVFTLSAQKQTNHWYFGINAGLDFTSGSPVVVATGALNTTEGTASIADSLGNKLFYTEGVNVWNKYDSLMPNGTGLAGDVSTTQSALIVKKPGSIKDYFIFTLPAEGTGAFRYSTVDMTLATGKGDVVSKNILLQNNVTEKMSAVHHCNGKDIWVLVHGWNNNAFSAYLVTAAGVSATPVVSNTGRVHKGVHGQMKISPSGSLIALVTDSMISAGPPYQGKAYLELLNFNNQTGSVTHSMSIALNNWQKAYGVEFSPNSSRVYATYYDLSGGNGGNSELIQYNLTATNVAASGFTIGASFDPNILRALQLGPDGKIYLSKSGTPFLCTIDAPNALGAAASYSDNAINVDPNSMGAGCMLGLPGFVQSYFHPSFPDIASCSQEPTVTAVPDQATVPGGLYYDQTSGVLRVPEKAGNSVLYRITDISGKIVLQGVIAAQEKEAGREVSVHGLPAGIYVVDCNNGEHRRHIKIVVDH